MSRSLHVPLLAAARFGAGLFGALQPQRAAHLRFDLWLEPWLRRRLELGGRPPAVPPGTTRDRLY